MKKIIYLIISLVIILCFSSIAYSKQWDWKCNSEEVQNFLLFNIKQKINTSLEIALLDKKINQKRLEFVKQNWKFNIKGTHLKSENISNKKCIATIEIYSLYFKTYKMKKITVSFLYGIMVSRNEIAFLTILIPMEDKYTFLF